MRRTAVFFLALVTAGCQMTSSEYLYKEGVTVAQKDRDSFECELEATRRVPTNTQFATTPTYTTPTYFTPVQTNCYGYTCTSTGGTAYGGQTYGGQTYSYDANASLRQEFMQKCMASRGYRSAVVPTCPNKSVSDDVRSRLGGQVRTPVEGSCKVAVTDRVSNVVYPSERSN